MIMISVAERVAPKARSRRRNMGILLDKLMVYGIIAGFFDESKSMMQ